MPIYAVANKCRKHESAGHHIRNFDVTRRGVWTFTGFGFVADIMIFRRRNCIHKYPNMNIISREATGV